MPRRLYPPAAHRPRLRPVTSPPRGLTQRTRGFTGTREPLVKTRIVELVVALRAPQFRELVVASVNHEVANGARLDARELLIVERKVSVGVWAIREAECGDWEIRTLSTFRRHCARPLATAPFWCRRIAPT
jgi:hypothetical protein